MFTASLSLEALQKGQGRARGEYKGTEDLYRQQWRWDKSFVATHCVDCYPGNCPYRVYVKDGLVLYEEQAGTDAALGLGMAQVLIEEGAIRRSLRQGADGPAAVGAAGQPPLPEAARPLRPRHPGCRSQAGLRAMRDETSRGRPRPREEHPYVP